MSRSVHFVNELVLRVPEFEEMLAIHVDDQNGEVLPHVFFWDVTVEMVDGYLGKGEYGANWREVLEFMEECAGLGVAEVDEVIVTSFLGNLPFPGSPGYGIVEELSPTLAVKFSRIRPDG
ncbi:hypothetical protein DSC45_00415 [Streptomyces sp. YIM 130001]|uniref:DUF7674 family protein n=1 Tax=Streptomyces sp. YIM 130001 TaxID=2259644 RepID=UPI000E654CE1|nr:hypothetical protein [Streptomyces sp. YIM 130001]RII22176.1 hypothetical protein DSC45_00415 [Streptomyces sp. YIM 130001]